MQLRLWKAEAKEYAKRKSERKKAIEVKKQKDEEEKINKVFELYLERAAKRIQTA